MSLTLKDYDLFHSMVAKPIIAKNCIRSFVKSNGCILFMPYDHSDHDIHLYDASHNNSLSVLSYYALVIFSFTGLSTILGMTDTIDVQDYTANGGLPIWSDQEGMISIHNGMPTNSIMEPDVRARECALKYVQNHIQTYNQQDIISTSKSTIRLQRRFEYNFKLFGGFNVIMLHLKSSDAPEITHLVEVYKVHNPIMRRIVSFMFQILAMIYVGEKNN